MRRDLPAEPAIKSRTCPFCGGPVTRWWLPLGEDLPFPYTWRQSQGAFERGGVEGEFFVYCSRRLCDVVVLFSVLGREPCGT